MQDRYHVIAGPPMSPDGVSVEGLGALAAALNALDQPAAAALDDLQADMVELAFNSLAPKDRQRLLGRTGIRMAAPAGQAVHCAGTSWQGFGARHGSTRAAAVSWRSPRP